MIASRWAIVAPRISELRTPDLTQATHTLVKLLARPNVLLLLVCLYLCLTQNTAFWSHTLKSVAGLPSSQSTLIAASVFFTHLTLSAVLLGGLSLHRLLKPVLGFALLLSPLTAYFMDRFDTVIDTAMVGNLLETTVGETAELLSRDLFNQWIVWGVLPCLALSRIPLVYGNAVRGIAHRIVLLAAMLVLCIGWILGHYQTLSFWGREHREVRLYVNPVFPIVSGLRSAWDHLTHHNNQPVWLNLGHDAVLEGPPRTVVLVVGETARTDHFGLNGYERNTTPHLSARHDVISFSDVTACGTYTALSVPCMFSRLGRDNWDATRAQNQDNLLDILALAGAQVSWTDNDGGCKGVCARQDSESLQTRSNGEDCPLHGCTDLALLPIVRQHLDKLDTDRSQLIVVHQFGSHGPAYHRRLPEDFEGFGPACTRDQPTLCAQQEVVNAYDNTILLTDQLIAALIAELDTRWPGRRRAVVYVSDHGESLGENGVYLHGLPYPLAPSAQKKVPLLMWLSGEYRNDLNSDCIARQTQRKLSHDNLFDLISGLMGLSSEVLQPELNPLQDCERPPGST